MTKQITLTARQLSRVALAMKNARIHIETEQAAELDLDQACIIFDLCTALSVDPEAVLGKEAINLINDIMIIAEVLQ